MDPPPPLFVGPEWRRSYLSMSTALPMMKILVVATPPRNVAASGCLPPPSKQVVPLPCHQRLTAARIQPPTHVSARADTNPQVSKVEAFARMDERQLRELVPSLDEDARACIAALRQAMAMVEMMK